MKLKQSRAPTSGTLLFMPLLFATVVFLSLFHPSTAHASWCDYDWQMATCGCTQHFGVYCANVKSCWYSTWDEHCRGHEWDKFWVDNPGDCENGAIAYAHCSICQHTFPLRGYTARGHSYGNMYDYGDPNYHRQECRNTSDGYDGGWKVYNACTSGSHNHYRYEAHSWSDWKTSATQHWRNCKVCGHETARGNHNWTDWHDNKNGTHTRTCKTCGYSQTVNHSYNGVWLDFDPEYYANTYPDLKEKYGYDAKKLYNYWLTYGQYEGQKCSDGSRHSQFCTADGCGAYIVEKHTVSDPYKCAEWQHHKTGRAYD